jgi:hypothetical protein
VPRPWLQVGAIAAFTGATAAVAAAIAGGIAEPTIITTVLAVIATLIQYAFAPLVLTLAMRQGGLSSWWAVAAATFAVALWSAAAVLYLMPTLVDAAPTLIDAVAAAAPSASALWLLAASVEVVRAGMHRWSLVVIGTFVAVLIIGSVWIELSGFDLRQAVLPLGWAAWMIDIGVALRTRLSPAVARPEPAQTEACANCGAPRRTDGLAFCSDCGLPYGTQRT